MGFVLAYRCGAAPDFHRVPYGLEDPRHQHDPQDMVVESAKSNNMLWSPRGDGQLVPRRGAPFKPDGSWSQAMTMLVPNLEGESF